MWVLPCKLPLIVVVAHKSYIVNRHIGVADSKYVVLDGPLPPGHVTWRMHIANFTIKMAHLHCFHPLLSNGSRQKHKIWQ